MSEMVKTPDGLVAVETLRKPSLARPCKTCKELSFGHRVNRDVYCCECYVRAGNKPAGWHPQCSRAQSAIRDEAATARAEGRRP